MAFPVVESSTRRQITSNTTAWGVTKPAGTVEGDLLLAFAHSYVSMTALSGWSSLAATGTGRMMWKIAGPSEPTSWSGTLGGSGGIYGSKCLRITGFDPSDPFSQSIGVGASPINPANLDPGLGVQDFLWLAIGQKRGSAGLGRPSEGWTTLLTTSSGGNTTNGFNLNSGYQNLAAASFDSGAWSYSSGGDALVGIFAVHPIPSASPVEELSSSLPVVIDLRGTLESPPLALSSSLPLVIGMGGVLDIPVTPTITTSLPVIIDLGGVLNDPSFVQSITTSLPLVIGMGGVLSPVAGLLSQVDIDTTTRRRRVWDKMAPFPKTGSHLEEVEVEDS